jgi:AcrR family transcriptional regulator
VRSTDGLSRNSERTRTAILDGTLAVLATRGSSATIATIALAANVSKGGVLHHFGTRDSLLLAATDYALGRFKQEVLLHVDLSENYPGKVLRAYVRVVTGASDSAGHVFMSPLLWRTIQSVSGVSDLLKLDAEAWTEEFGRDGLHIDRIQLARRAADGLAAARSSEPYLDAEDLRRERSVILSLTMENGEL